MTVWLGSAEVGSDERRTQRMTDKTLLLLELLGGHVRPRLVETGGTQRSLISHVCRFQEILRAGKGWL